MFPCPRLPWNWSVFKCIAWRCGWCWWAGGSCTGKTQASQSSVQPQNLPGLLTVTTLGIWTVEDGRRANVELKHMLSRFFAKMTPMTVNLVNLPLKDKYKSLTWDETCWKLQRCQHVPDRHITFVSRSSLSRWQLCLISIFMVTCFSQTSNVLNLISKQLLVSIFWILKHLLVQDSVSLCAQTQCGLWYIKVLTFPIKYKIQQELPWIEWNYCFCSSESINLVTWTQASKNWNRMAKKQFLGIYFNHCFRWSEHFTATN